MDGENNGKPYEQMDDLGVPLFLETPILIYYDSIFSLRDEKKKHFETTLFDLTLVPLDSFKSLATIAVHFHLQNNDHVQSIQQVISITLHKIPLQLIDLAKL